MSNAAFANTNADSQARFTCIFTVQDYNTPNNTRQGYARKSTLKLAGYLFLEA